MLNKSIIMGRLVADPEIRQTPSNVPVCKFTVAVDRDFVPQGQERQADFVSVIAWRHTAEFVGKYFTRGSLIVVEGRLKTGSYTDNRYPDVKHYTTDIEAEQVYFGGSKKDSGTAQPSAPEDIGDLGEFEEIIGDGEKNLPF